MSVSISKRAHSKILMIDGINSEHVKLISFPVIARKVD